MTKPIDPGTVVLCRYLGEFEPADEKTAAYRKTSYEICQDLSEMTTTISQELVTALMIENGFRMSFEDDKPVWLMRKRTPKEPMLPEKAG